MKDFIHIGIVKVCGGNLTHWHHYLRRVSAATTLDNIMRYTVYIKYILQLYNKVRGTLTRTLV
jgi:hypothetical protein